MGNCCCMEGLMRPGGPFGIGMLPPPSCAKAGWTAIQTHVAHTDSGLLEAYHISSGLLGEGAFGTVRISTCQKTGERCVLKSIDKRNVPANTLVILANEIAIHKVCDHPHIARVYEVFECSHMLNMAMEICRGGEVLELLESQGSLSEKDASLVIQQVLQAVFYLHVVKHVAHRDLKPENLLLKFKGVPLADNTVKVIDFGLAGGFTPGDRSLHELCGTPMYMAPETTLGPYNEKCDIWSCGVMLYELLSGNVPFDGDNIWRILAAAAANPLHLEGGDWEAVSGPAKALLRRMCDRDVSARISAEQALKSAWFRCQLSPSSSAAHPKFARSESILENMRKFSTMNDFEKAALRLAAYHMEDPHVAKQRNVFKRLDVRGDGRLTQEEFEQGCLQMGLTAVEARDLFQQLDQDGNGVVAYSEFLSASVDKESISNRACWGAFRVCDRDGSGSISHENAREVVGRRSVRLSKADELDYEKFVAMLRRSKMVPVGSVG